MSDEMENEEEREEPSESVPPESESGSESVAPESQSASASESGSETETGSESESVAPESQSASESESESESPGEDEDDEDIAEDGAPHATPGEVTEIPAAAAEGGAPAPVETGDDGDGLGDEPEGGGHGGHGHGGEGSTFRQLMIVLLLVGGMIGLHFLAIQSDEQSFDPTAMLALGFVVLASFTIGSLVDVIKLPHITGYLIAGMLFGPSIASFIPIELWPPFDEGVLNYDVIELLRPLNTLAVALIALTAGGELKLDGLRKGIGAILGVLGIQLVAVLIVVTLFFYAVSGAFPAIALPGLGDLGPSVWWIGLTVAAISFATSPAATIAVINETGAKGAMSRTVLSAVVIKDVLVVVLFGVFSALAAQSLGAGSTGSVATKLAIEILGSMTAGVTVGALVALYLRFVGQELLLFIVGIIYATTLVASELHLDGVLIFLTAGFVVSNFSKAGDTLIHTVERLSTPVYVVFFTIAGAGLHLDEVMNLGLFALGLVGARIFAIYIGVKLGAIIGSADESTRKYGWMGFLSQAGVAITFAGFLADPSRFPEEVHALSGLLIAGVALNEVLGPVALKIALGLAGEIGSRETEEEEEEEAEEGPSPAELEPWPEDVQPVDWGAAPDTGSVELDRLLNGLEEDLRALVREVSAGAMLDFRRNAETYLRELRREYLRHHRRILVEARGVGEQSEDSESKVEARQGLALMLHDQQAELAERWRATVLARAAQLSSRTLWSPERIVEALDDLVAGVPETIRVPYHPESFKRHEGDGVFKAFGRFGLRFRRGAAKLFGRPMGKHEVQLRDLVRYHLAGLTPMRLEGVAALVVDAERHLAGRTRQLFDAIVHAYDALADDCADLDLALDERVKEVRADVEEGLMLALDEVNRIGRDGVRRTGLILSQGLRAVKSEAPFYGTLDLPDWERRSSRVFRERVEALEALTKDLGELRGSAGGEYALLAMELELIGLEARVKDLLGSHRTRLEGEVRRRVVQQADRVVESFLEALQHVRSELGENHDARTMGAVIRQIAENAEKTAGEGARIARELREELLDQEKIAPLIDALGEAATALTVRYQVIAGRLQHGEWKLPSVVPPVEVPFRETVLDTIDTRVAPRLLRATRETADQIQPLAAAMREAERLLAFNTELATAELEVLGDEPVPSETLQLIEEMVVGQLERSEGTLEAFLDSARHWPEELGAHLHEAALGTLSELRGQLVDGEITRAKLDELRRSANRRRLAQRAVRLPELLREVRGQLRRAAVLLIGETRLELWRRWLGLPAPHEDLVMTPEAFAPPAPRVKLPLVYERLFAADTMEASDVLTGREEQIRRAREYLTPAKGSQGSGRRRAVAVIGLDGVGKASVISAIVRGGRWKSVKRFNLDRPMSVADVDRLLDEAKHGSLIVIDGLYWMLAAEPGGFQPLRHFVDGVLADGDQRSWLVQAEEVFWRYAAAVAPLAEAFPEMVQLEPLTADELTAAVMERHRLSGYGHAFDRLEGESWLEGWLARSASKIRRPYEQYFKELHGATGGLVRDALRLWLSSIRGIEADDIVKVGHVPSSGYTAVNRLPTDQLLLLFQVARQGWMNDAVLAHLFRSDRRTARAQLARLRHLGLLESADGEIFRISLHLRGALARVIRERGWA